MFLFVDFLWVMTSCGVVVGYNRSEVHAASIFLPQHYTASQPRRPRPEDGDSMDIRNSVTLTQHCTALLSRRPRLGPSVFVSKVTTFHTTLIS